MLGKVTGLSSEELMNRVRYIDALKGLAIIFVVLGHVSNGYINQGAINELFVGTHKIATAFHMPLFFAVSGFLFCRAYISNDGSVKREKLNTQILNLVCIYCFYSALLWVFKYSLSAFVNTQLTVKNLLMIPIKPFELYWYLYIVILYYLVFSCTFVNRQNEYAIIILTIAMAVISYWVPETWLFGIKNFLYFIPYFHLGCVISRHVEMQNKKALVFALVPILVLFFTIFWNNEKQINSIRFVNLIVGIGMTICLFGAFKQYRFLGDNKILSSIGRYSLEIYLFHTYFVTFCRTVFNKLRIDNSLMIIVISTSIGVVAPIVIACISKKIGIHKYMFAPYKTLVKNRNPKK